MKEPDDGRGLTRRESLQVSSLVAGAVFVLVVLLVVSGTTVSAQSLPPQAAWQANAHQLGNRVLKAIQQVERSELDCQVRNLLVRRLRLLHDAITSGRGTAARGLLNAWLEGVRRMQGAQLLSAEQGSVLQVEMMELLEQVGEGWPEKPMPTRNWPPLPSCEPDQGKAHSNGSNPHLNDGPLVVGGIYDGPVFTLSDCQHILAALVGAVPIAGKILGPLVYILWPDSGPDIYELIDEAITGLARDTAVQDLENMERALDKFLSIEMSSPSQVDEYFAAAELYIYAGLGTFQWNHTDVGGEDYRVEFLPLFAQAENLYLALLREAVLHGAEWGWDADTVEFWRQTMKAELDPNDKTKGLGYALDIYQLGLSDKPTGDSQSDWTTRNQYVREMTLGVLDFTEIWKYMDPYAYPNGVPNLKLTRMIYSDPIGVTDHTFKIPPYAYGPLRELTVWVDEGAVYPFIDAIQVTGGPTAGPVLTGPIMGDSELGGSPTRFDFDVAPGSVDGPIIAVEGYSAMFTQIPEEKLSGLHFSFAGASLSSGLLGSQLPERPWLISTPHVPMTTSAYYFSYPGESVASVQVMGNYKFEVGRWGADSVVFGFRFADSYYPSGSVVNSATSGCMAAVAPVEGAPVELGSLLDCYTHTWTYNSALRRLIVHDLCLDTDTDGNAILNACEDGPTQRWNIVPSGAGGTIGRDGLVLTPSPSSLKLVADTGAINQRWKTPNNVQGPVHAVATGMCLGNASTPVSGTFMKVYNCVSGATPGQTWTYSPSMATLSLLGGTLCLDVPGDPVAGAPVQVNACNADESQQWFLKSNARIQHAKSGLYLDLYGFAGSPGASFPVVLGEDTDATTQHWTWPMY